MNIVVINICVLIILVLLLGWVIFLSVKYIKIMRKLGNGTSLDIMLGKYLREVENIYVPYFAIKSYSESIRTENCDKAKEIFDELYIVYTDYTECINKLKKAKPDEDL